MNPNSDNAVQVVCEFWRLMSSNDFSAVGAMLADNCVLDWPQSNERIQGREKFAAVNAEYPSHGKWIFTMHRMFGNAAEVVPEVSVTDGVQNAKVISFFTVHHGKITHQVEYWPEPYAAPANRQHLVEAIE